MFRQTPLEGETRNLALQVAFFFLHRVNFFKDK